MLRLGSMFRLVFRPLFVEKKNISETCRFLRRYCSIETPLQEQRRTEIKSTDSIKSKDLSSPEHVPSRLQEEFQYDNRRQSLFSSYQLMKLKIEQNKTIDKPDLLLKGLIGALMFRRESEFLRIYDGWWKLLFANLQNFDTDTLCEMLSSLGNVNFSTKNSLRRNLSREHINILISRIMESDFNELKLKSIGQIYRGLHRLCTSLESANTDDEYPPKELIAKTIHLLNSFKPNDVNFDDAAISTVFVFHSLANVGRSLDRESLKILLSISKTMLDRLSTINGDELKYNFAYKKFLLTQKRFVDSFIKWHVNPEEVVPSLWQSWFEATKNLFVISPKFETVAKFDDVERDKNAPRDTDDEATIELKKFRHTEGRASHLIQLCTAAADVAWKFQKVDLFSKEDFKKIWNEILEKHIADAFAMDVNRLYHSLRTLETVIKSKSPFETDSIVSTELWAIMKKKVDEANNFRAQRDAARNKWNRDDDRDDGRRNFGGGFKEFSGRRFERPEDTRRSYEPPRLRQFDESRSNRPFRPENRRRDDERPRSNEARFNADDSGFSTFRGRPSRFSQSTMSGGNEFDDDITKNQRFTPNRRIRSGDIDDDDDSIDDRRSNKFRRSKALIDDDIDEDFGPRSRFKKEEIDVVTRRMPTRPGAKRRSILDEDDD